MACAAFSPTCASIVRGTGIAELDGIFPLWGKETATLVYGFVLAGYRAILTCVDTNQLGPEFAGRDFDARLLADLPATVAPCGERGEFHYAGRTRVAYAIDYRSDRFRHETLTMRC